MPNLQNWHVYFGAAPSRDVRVDDEPDAGDWVGTSIRETWSDFVVNRGWVIGRCGDVTAADVGTADLLAVEDGRPLLPAAEVEIVVISKLLLNKLNIKKICLLVSTKRKHEKTDMLAHK